MRNKNIFIRKESEFSCLRGQGLPVFANVVASSQETRWDNDLGKSVPYGELMVHYAVDYPEKTKGGWRWHYADREYQGERTRSGTYVKPLEEFLQRFMPDYSDEYQAFAG